jgi:hypothetical protein
MFGGGSFLSSPKAPSFIRNNKQSITNLLMKLTAITPLLKAKIRQAFRVDQAAAWMYN